MSRSVAHADVAELSGALEAEVKEEKNFHLVIVSTNKVLSTTQFKQMFYSRGDDFFQIANAYECPDSRDSIHSSVWGIDCADPHASSLPNAGGLVEMGRAEPNLGRLGDTGLTGYSQQKQVCYNFNKLGGRDNDPAGVAWAYSYVHDGARNFYAQHEAMGFLEQDTCVKRDRWTSCSRLSIEDQLYSLAFASETDQDLCLKVTCARRWSEVEDALAESCTASDNVQASPISSVQALDSIMSVNFNVGVGRQINFYSGTTLVATWEWGANNNTPITAYNNMVGALSAWGVTSGSGVWAVDQNTGNRWITYVSGYTFIPGAIGGNQSNPVFNAFGMMYGGNVGNSGGGPFSMDGNSCVSYEDNAGIISTTQPFLTHWKSRAIRPARDGQPQGFVDLYINVRVTNGHPEALDTIFRVRFTVAYVFHEPSALNTWNIRASKAASGVIQSGVVGDAPEGGKEQAEDTTVVVP